LKRIIDYDWSISYGLKLTTAIVDWSLDQEEYTNSSEHLFNHCIFYKPMLVNSFPSNIGIVVLTYLFPSIVV